MKGKIKRIVTDRSSGFIEGEDGRDFFFHRSKLKGLTFEKLYRGEEVEFDVDEFRGPTTPKAPIALNVRALRGKDPKKGKDNG